MEENNYQVGGGRTINITMSFGSALFPENAKEKQKLIDKADKALYKAKETGRNKVVRAV
ncbi:MAG: diguanylate cyclase [Fibrobacterota bacterium]